MSFLSTLIRPSSHRKKAGDLRRAQTVFYDVRESGLANRLRGLVACAAIAKLAGAKLVMRWTPNQACPAGFEELFETPDWVELTQDAIKWETPPFVVTERFGVIRFWEEFIRGSHLTASQEEFIALSRVYVRSLAPTPSIEREIAATQQRGLGVDTSGVTPSKDAELRGESADRWRRHVVGLHIRRTDFSHQADTPDDAFWRVMDLERRLDPDVRFFLATDNATTSKIFEKDEGILTAATHYEAAQFRDFCPGDRPHRHTTMRAAMIDLYLLSRCRKVYGCRGSSYGRWASWVGEMPFEIPEV